MITRSCKLFLSLPNHQISHLKTILSFRRHKLTLKLSYFKSFKSSLKPHLWWVTLHHQRTLLFTEKEIIKLYSIRSLENIMNHWGFTIVNNTEQFITPKPGYWTLSMFAAWWSNKPGHQGYWTLPYLGFSTVENDWEKSLPTLILACNTTLF